MMNDKLIEQLKRHEGFKPNVYKCTNGHNTIGYGYNLDANPLALTSVEINHYYKSGITLEDAERLLILMVNKVVKEVSEALPWWSKVPGERQDVLINMAYNLGLGRWGVDGLLEFRKTLAHVQNGNYFLASEEMLNSDWANQVGDRAKELANQMRTGHYA